MQNKEYKMQNEEKALKRKDDWVKKAKLLMSFVLSLVFLSGKKARCQAK